MVANGKNKPPLPGASTPLPRGHEHGMFRTAGIVRIGAEQVLEKVDYLVAVGVHERIERDRIEAVFHLVAVGHAIEVGVNPERKRAQAALLTIREPVTVEIGAVNTHRTHRGRLAGPPGARGGHVPKKRTVTPSARSAGISVHNRIGAQRVVYQRQRGKLPQSEQRIDLRHVVLHQEKILEAHPCSRAARDRSPHCPRD